jgi:hypothetical protein
MVFFFNFNACADGYNMDCADVLSEIFSWLGDDLYNVRRVNKLFQQVANVRIAGDMPAGVIWKILSCLEVEQLYVVRQVNRHFKKMADQVMLHKMSFCFYVDGVKHTNPDILYGNINNLWISSKFVDMNIYFADAIVRIVETNGHINFECAGLIYQSNSGPQCLRYPVVCLRAMSDRVCPSYNMGCLAYDSRYIGPDTVNKLMPTYIRYFLRYIHPLLYRGGQPLKVPFNYSDYDCERGRVHKVYLHEAYYNPKVTVVGSDCSTKIGNHVQHV